MGGAGTRCPSIVRIGIAISSCPYSIEHFAKSRGLEGTRRRFPHTMAIKIRGGRIDNLAFPIIEVVGDLKRKFRYLVSMNQLTEKRE